VSANSIPLLVHTIAAVAGIVVDDNKAKQVAAAVAEVELEATVLAAADEQVDLRLLLPVAADSEVEAEGVVVAANSEIEVEVTAAANNYVKVVNAIAVMVIMM
jgi:hypothetical protein